MMLEPLRRIVQEVNAAPDFGTVLEIIVEQVKSAMNTGMCSIYLFDPVSKRYILSATRGLLPESVGKVAMTTDEGLVGLVASRAEPVNLEHAETHPRFAYFPETGEERFSSFLGAPIIHQREVLGVLVVQQGERRRFDESEEAFLITVSAQLAGVIAHAEATGELVRVTAPETEADSAALYPGIASAPGIGIGHGVVVSSPADLYAVPKRRSEDIPGQLEQFRRALKKTKQDVRATKDELRGVLSREELEMFDIYLRMLEDHALGGEVIALIDQGFTAESEYLRERASDVRDLGRRVLEHLQETNRPAQRVYPDDTILIGEDLAAPHLAEVPFERLRGIVSVRGAHNSHMAIIGRAMGIPTVMGAIDLPWTQLEGQRVIVDGHMGHILVDPSPEVERAFAKVFRQEQILAADLLATRDEPSITACGAEIRLWVNTGLRVDTKLSLATGAAGVGLYRTEIPFFLQERFPSEEEQRQIYRDQLQIYAPRPVTMRTLDIGGDKSLPYFPISEENPFLGWRGIRVTLDHPEIFLAQVRAMMRASEGIDNLRILLPMISNIEEVDSALALIARVYTELTVEEGYRIDMPKVGAMIEVPAAVYQTHELAQRVDFLSVGTNDLTQYLLAVDRNNPRVAALYHGYHPALLKALRHILAEASALGREVSVCGELAGDPMGAALLVGLGYRTLSMSAANLLRVKAVLRQLTLAEMAELAVRLLELPDATSVKHELRQALQRPGLECLLHTSGGRGAAA